MLMIIWNYILYHKIPYDMVNRGLARRDLDHTRPRLRLRVSVSSWRDWYRSDMICISTTRMRPRPYNMVTKTTVSETIRTNYSIWFEASLSFHCDRDLLRQGNSTAIETETYQDSELSYISRARLCETAILRLQRPRLIEIGFNVTRPRLYK